MEENKYDEIMNENENNIIKIDNDNKEGKKAAEILSRKTTNNLYGEEYDKISLSIKEMEEQTKKYFKDIGNKLEEKFKEFNLNLNNNFVKLSNKFSKAFGLDEENVDQEKAKFLQNNTKKYLEQLIKIKNMIEQIIDSIKMEISILINSLDISKSLEEEKPIPKFLAKEFNNIVNSWIFIKLDFENFNLTKTINSSNIDNDFKDFIYKVCQNKNFIMSIGPVKGSDEILNAYDYEEIQKQDSILMAENCKNLTKMKVNKIRNADIPFKLDNKNFPKLRYLKFNNCSFSEQKDEKCALIGKCVALEKLIINGAHNFEANMLKDFSKNLTKLVLSNNNFVNSDFKNIMENYIIKSESLRNNLELLSFSNNSLSNIDMEFSSRYKFHALKELDFHKNRINKFKFEPNCFFQLKCINCCYNKFSKSEFEANNDILSLLSGNLFLTDLNKCKNYYTKIEKQLNDYNISLSHLTISYLPNDFGKEYLERIIINNNILISLKKLDLSHNNLTCDVLFNFIQNNMGCINLKDLNLSGNKLDDTFFEKFLEYKYHTIFTKLQKINLSDNLIGNESEINPADLGEESINKNRVQDIFKLRLIYKFIEKNKNLSKLYLTKNPMSEKSVISTDIDMNGISALISRDKNNNDRIIIDNFYSFLKKVTEELLMNREEKVNRGQFNIKFDIDTHINLNSDNFNYNEKFIMFN
jgi:hypothetical protein